jgi:hypothetical protein
VIPEQIEGSRASLNATLGYWLSKHVQKRRNTVRFLLPASDAQSLYSNEELLHAARCRFLCSPEGWGKDPTYRGLLQEFDRPLRQSLERYFNRFALLRKWNFQQSQNCVFEVEKIAKQGKDIPAAVEEQILSDLFDRDDFKTFVLNRAKDGDFVGTLMDDLLEPPPPNTGDAIPYLGEVKLYELVLDIAAEGALVLNVGGTWIGRRAEDANDEDAKRSVRARAFRIGQEMRQIQLGLPGAVGGGAVTVPQVPVIITPSNNTSTETAGGYGQTDTIENGAAKEPKVVREGPPENGWTATNNTLVEPPPVIAPVIQTKRTAEPATGINLSGAFEGWGVAVTQTIDTARIEFSGLTAQQMKQILQRIPSTFKATLEIAYKEEGES